LKAWPRITSRQGSGTVLSATPTIQQTQFGATSIGEARRMSLLLSGSNRRKSLRAQEKSLNLKKNEIVCHWHAESEYQEV
jgi:hypothetical protein